MIGMFGLNMQAGMGAGILNRAMGMSGGLSVSAGLNIGGMSLGAGFGMDTSSFSPDAMMGGTSNFFHPLMSGGGMGMPQCGSMNGMGMVPGMMNPFMMGMNGQSGQMMQMMMLMQMLMELMQQNGMGGGMPGMGCGMPGMGCGAPGMGYGMPGGGGGYPGVGSFGSPGGYGSPIGMNGSSPGGGAGRAGAAGGAGSPLAEQATGPVPYNAATGNKIADMAAGWAGKSFKPGQTCRCADFVSTIIEQSGMKPPGFKHQMSCDGLQKYGKPVDRNNLKPGDIVFFGNTYRQGKYTHTGIYLGNGKFAHRPTANKPVKIDNLNSSYYKQHYSGARRLG